MFLESQKLRTPTGMVCGKMTERVEVPQYQEEDRRIRKETVTVDILDDEEYATQEDQEDDEGLQTREISGRSQT
jgi:hypothetical protein